MYASSAPSINMTHKNITASAIHQESNLFLRYLAATHLEPTYARSIFPCFDEPALKAKFSVNILHDQKYRAMSNMPLQGEPELV